MKETQLAVLIVAFHILNKAICISTVNASKIKLLLLLVLIAECRRGLGTAGSNLALVNWGKRFFPKRNDN